LADGQRRPSAPLIMGVFAGSVAALAVLPVALLLAAWDTEGAISLAAEKAVVMAEFRAASATLERPVRLFEQVEVATMVLVGRDGQQVVEQGEALVLPVDEPSFTQLCDKPGTYDLISLDGRRWAWSCAHSADGNVLVGVEPETINLVFVTFLMFILMAVVGLVTALAVLRVLTPLSRINAALARVRAGERNVRLQATGLAELDEIIYQVNDTASAMEEREDTIMARIRVAQRMARMVAHEVRNPLQSIELLTSLIVSETDPTERQATGDAIRKEVRDLDQVVTQMLRRSVGDDLSLLLRPTSLTPLIEHVVQVHSSTAAKQGLSVELGDIETPSLPVDSALVGRSLENLVQNAMQHAEHRIQISTRSTDHGVDILIDDDGPGVPPSIAERVFSANVSLREGGTGLGLALVQAVAEAHGGHATHESSPLGGARFVLHLPVRSVDIG